MWAATQVGSQPSLVLSLGERSIPGASVITWCRQLSLVTPTVHSFILHFSPLCILPPAKRVLELHSPGSVFPKAQAPLPLLKKSSYNHPVAQASDLESSWSSLSLTSHQQNHSTPDPSPNVPGPPSPMKLQLAFVQRISSFSLLGMAWSPKPVPRSPLLQAACPDAPTYPRSLVSSQPPPASTSPAD